VLFEEAAMTAESTPSRSTLGALALVVGVLGAVVLLPRIFPSGESAMVGRQAPDFDLRLVANGDSLGSDAQTLRLRDLRGRAVVLDFWATWCDHCRAEAPVVERVAKRWKDRNVAIVGVDTDTPGQGDPREFARRLGLSYPIVHDIEGDATRAYGIEGLPTLVVVSPLGRVVAVRSGETDDRELDRLVKLAL
jgi:cytochrome c biogenesis protein CcmG, thiol:disulfide interchange protein DsbE